MDLLVKLYDFQCNYNPVKIAENGITIKRAMSPDKTKILEFIKKEYTQNWADESEYALMNSPISCYVAVKNGEIVGFSCYDATAKGFLGPIGIKSNEKGAGIGQALLYHTLMGMKEYGYGYAIIGWVDDALEFYRKTLNIIEIPDSSPEKSVYQNLINLVYEDEN